MKKLLIIAAFFISFCVHAQYRPNATMGTVSNKPYALAQAGPLDARSYYYDATNFIYRPFTSKAEALGYLDQARYRVGHFPVIINYGGVIQPDGSLVGGVNSEYWFKDGLGDSDLVLKTAEAIAPQINMADSGYIKNVSTLTFGFGFMPDFYNGILNKTVNIDTTVIASRAALDKALNNTSDTQHLTVNAIVTIPDPAATLNAQYLIDPNPPAKLPQSDSAANPFFIHANSIATLTLTGWVYSLPNNNDNLIVVNDQSLHQYSGTYPYGTWSIQSRAHTVGGERLGIDPKAGTIDNHDFIFITDSNEVGRFTKDGKLRVQSLAHAGDLLDSDWIVQPNIDGTLFAKKEQTITYAAPLYISPTGQVGIDTTGLGNSGGGTPETILSSVNALMATPVLAVNVKAEVSDTVRGGTFVSRLKSQFQVDSGIVFPSANATYVWVRQTQQGRGVNIRWYGVNNGDTITRVLNKLAVAGYSIITLDKHKTYYIDSVGFNSYVNLSGDSVVLKAAAPSIVNAPMLAFMGDHSILSNVIIDAQGGTREMVKSVGNHQQFNNVQVFNLSADTTSTTFTSAFVITGNNTVCSNIYAFNFNHNSRKDTNININGSIPRVFTVQGTADGTRINNVEADSIYGFITVGALTGTTYVNSAYVKYGHDNGIYQLGGAGMYVDNFVYTGDEEALVCKHAGFFEGGYISINKRWTECIGLQDANYVHIRNLSIDQDTSGSGAIIKTRSQNNASDTLIVDNISGTIRGHSLFSFTKGSGTLQYLKLGNANVIYFYRPDITAGLGNFADFTGVKGFDMNLTLSIVDETGALASTDRFIFNLPRQDSAQLFYPSTISCRVKMVNGMTLGQSNAQFRGTNFNQPLITTKDIIWDNKSSSTNSYAREFVPNTADYSNTTNAKPSVTQTYPIGTRFNNRTATFEPFSFTKTDSSTWVPSGTHYIRQLTGLTYIVDSSADEIMRVNPNLGHRCYVYLPNPADTNYVWTPVRGINGGWSREFTVMNQAMAGADTNSVWVKTTLVAGSNRLVNTNGTSSDSIQIMPRMTVTFISDGSNWRIYNKYNPADTVKAPSTTVLTPSYTLGTGAGTGATASFGSNSGDLAGYITVNTGTSPVAGGDIVTINYATPLTAIPKAILINGANDRAKYDTNIWFASQSSATTTNYKIKNISTSIATAPLQPSTTYIFYYHVTP